MYREYERKFSVIKIKNATVKPCNSKAISISLPKEIFEITSSLNSNVFIQQPKLIETEIEHPQLRTTLFEWWKVETFEVKECRQSLAVVADDRGCGRQIHGTVG